jgi:hypothetical protein
VRDRPSWLQKIGSVTRYEGAAPGGKRLTQTWDPNLTFPKLSNELTVER